MIRIIYERSDYTVTTVGHANYAEEGKDVVCAAITALTEAMMQRVTGRSCWQPAYGINKEKAIVRVSLTPRSRHAEETAREMLETVCAGYREVADLYPDYVRFEVR